MIAATLTVTTTATSIFDLIQTATPGQLPAADKTTGRVTEIHIQWQANDSFLVWKPGSVNTATDSGFAFSDPSVAGSQAKGLMVIRSGVGANVLNLKDVYLVTAAGTATVKVTAYSI